MAYQVFVSHTKKDAEFFSFLDQIFARVELERYRSEREEIQKEMEKRKVTEWQIIKENIEKSNAMFLLIGKELSAAQARQDGDWVHTQNWIAFEIGIACQKGIDVWVVCDEGIKMNFPVPYLNHYIPICPRNQTTYNYLKKMLKLYEGGVKFEFDNLKKQCPGCNMPFNLHTTLRPNDKITCPTCLEEISFPDGFNNYPVVV